MAEEATTTKKPTPADQGVPAVYLNEDGKAFRIGMDARLKSDLVNSVVGAITKDSPGNSLQVFTEKDAMKILEARGWTSFLDRKRELIAADVAKKAASAEKREALARERADEKAKKDAAKAQEKEAKAAEKKAAEDKANAEGAAASAAKASGQAAPDPKGGGRKK